MQTVFARQVTLLALLQGLFLTNNVTLIAINGLAGYALTSNKALATLPITAYLLGSALMTIPASRYMKRNGRAAGYKLGAIAALVGSLIAFFAVQAGSLAFLCLGTLVAGTYPAFSSTLRFTAAEVADAVKPDYKSRAISWVLMGGILGGIIGPELSKLTRVALPGLFSATYLSLAGFALLSLALTHMLRIPAAPAGQVQGEVRPLLEILRQPNCWIAVLGAVIAYAVMNLLMVATPLAMDVCKHPYASAALVIEWHVIGMFAPGLFTGHLISKFGSLKIMIAGCVLMLICTAIALAGVDIMNFLAALLVLGVGWNFLFTGATTLLTQSHRPSEKAKVQGFNELCVFTTMISSSFSSGALLHANGWAMLNWVSIPVILFMLMVLLYKRPQPIAA
jgi:MFS family permease